MKESVGYTVTLNIVITFIIIVFAFLSATLVYYKSNKASNVVTDYIERYGGYNLYVKNAIDNRLTDLGYDKKNVNCNKYYNRIGEKERNKCRSISLSDENEGYCVFVCIEESQQDKDCYYYYKISTNMMINIPIINDLLDIPIFSNTNRLYDFEDQTSCK